jgi:hypothetical protein
LAGSLFFALQSQDKKGRSNRKRMERPSVLA